MASTLSTITAPARTTRVGQSNNANVPWPQTPLNDYVRAIDLRVPSSRATWSTYARTVQGGTAALAPAQQNILPTSPGGWSNQLEIWTTPWGFLKGAAANKATVKTQTVDGKRYQVVSWDAPMKSPGGSAVQAGGLHQREQPGREGPDVGRARGVR